ncbi:MAG: hypothetical protein WAX89_06840 [Alphaproteobacteria bacterium]
MSPRMPRSHAITGLLAATSMALFAMPPAEAKSKPTPHFNPASLLKNLEKGAEALSNITFKVESRTTGTEHGGLGQGTAFLAKIKHSSGFILPIIITNHHVANTGGFTSPVINPHNHAEHWHTRTFTHPDHKLSLNGTLLFQLSSFCGMDKVADKDNIADFAVFWPDFDSMATDADRAKLRQLYATAPLLNTQQKPIPYVAKRLAITAGYPADIATGDLSIQPFIVTEYSGMNTLELSPYNHPTMAEAVFSAFPGASGSPIRDAKTNEIFAILGTTKIAESKAFALPLENLKPFLEGIAIHFLRNPQTPFVSTPSNAQHCQGPSSTLGTMGLPVDILQDLITQYPNNRALTYVQKTLLAPTQQHTELGR